MKKILIIAFFFPPCNFTSAERSYAWAKYLYKFGYYPIIITRNWDFAAKKPSDTGIESGSDVIVKQLEHCEVHYLPYKADWRDKFQQNIGHQFGKLSAIFFILYYFIEPLFLYKVSPFYNQLYKYCKGILAKDEQITQCLISASPFMQFKVGYDLKKKFKQLQLVADYRDDWTTNDILFAEGTWIKRRLIVKYLGFFEKKWIASYDFFLSVSDHYVEKLQKFHNKVGLRIENGYLPENYTKYLNEELFEDFTIIYSGTLYHTQPIEVFLEAVKRVVDSGRTKIKVKFIGIKISDKETNRVQQLSKGYEQYFELTSRIDKDQCIKIFQKSHLMLAVGHVGIGGTPGSKLYEYLALRKPVLVCPLDGDIMESTLKEARLGIYANTVEECFAALVKEYDGREGQKLVNINEDYIDSYSREKLVKKFVTFLESYRN